MYFQFHNNKINNAIYWGNKEWLAVHYGEFEEARGWVILNNARAERVHYSESPTRVPLQIPIMHS